MTDPLERFRNIFFEESAEAIDAIERNLLNLNDTQANIEPEMIDDIFRSAHSLKGGSATFGMEALTDFTHVMETLLDKVRANQIEYSPDLTDNLFSSLDVLRNLVSHYQYNDEIDEAQMKSVQEQLEQLLIKSNQQAQADSQSQSMAATHAQKHREWKIKFHPNNDILSSGNDPVRYLEELGDLGEVSSHCDTSMLPPFKEIEPFNSYLSWDITLTSQNMIDNETFEDIFMWIEDEVDISYAPIDQSNQDEVAVTSTESSVSQRDPISDTISDKTENRTETVSSDTATQQSNPVTTSSVEKKRTSQSIRVDLEKIDSLINLLGELVITQSMLSIYSDAEKYPQFERLAEGLSQLERHTRDLQEGVMRIRMLPIDFCFSRFPRMVRDLAKKLNKSITVDIIGETTEVDKTVIEELNDPLLHLVRNSVDHGIESPDERRAKGKPETATVTLKAFHQVGNIIIEISDDGSGLDTDKIREKAIQKDIITRESQLNEQAIHELVFTPGFSTVSSVTDISGRGVGMDVVKKNIKALGGTVDVRSEREVGTTFTIRLPLTLAILDGQLVKVHNETYIIPMLSIIESIQMNPEEINKVGKTGVSFRWRGNLIPIICLAKSFDCPVINSDHQSDQSLIVVVESDGKQCGIVVDELTNHQQVVVKSLEANYAKVEELSGATILGDGSVALIIDVGALISRVRMH